MVDVREGDVVERQVEEERLAGHRTHSGGEGHDAGVRVVQQTRVLYVLVKAVGENLKQYKIIIINYYYELPSGQSPNLLKYYYYNLCRIFHKNKILAVI